MFVPNRPGNVDANRGILNDSPAAAPGAKCDIFDWLAARCRQCGSRTETNVSRDTRNANSIQRSAGARPVYMARCMPASPLGQTARCEIATRLRLMIRTRAISSRFYVVVASRILRCLHIPSVRRHAAQTTLVVTGDLTSLAVISSITRGAANIFIY